jgi:glutamate-1-semialdehyde 2,1-aminomutase
MAREKPRLNREFPRSRQSHDRARLLIPGGVNSPARAFGGVGGHPLVIDSGAGAYLRDLDGNRYIDYVASWGPLILGHAHPRVLEAVQHALARGTTFGAPTELESDLAELVVRAMPSVEKIRFVSTGTEATMSAIRLARGFTTRDGIVKFAGCYHGHVDALLVQAGSSATTLGVPSSPGVPVGATRDTIVLPFNDPQRLEQAFDEHPGQIAGVILEPFVGNMGLVEPSGEFLRAARELTRRHGALLIFDEVITGFRVALGGAQEVLGIRPDLTVLGKILGGGLPAGAFGGRADIMDRMLPSGPVFQAGTLSGNPLAMAAGAATLRELRDNPPYERLERLTTRLARGLRDAALDANVPHTIPHVASMFTLFFNPDPVTDYAAAARSDTRAFARFFWSMIEQGVYLPCSQFEAAFVSTAHADADIDATIAAARRALQEVKRGD